MLVKHEWWHRPIILALPGLRQEDHKLEATGVNSKFKDSLRIT